MIEHEKPYLEFIKKRGVGSKDRIASSPDAYVSYLRAVSRITGMAIAPSSLRSEAHVIHIASKLNGERAPKTVKNYCSAMRQYVALRV